MHAILDGQKGSLQSFINAGAKLDEEPRGTRMKMVCLCFRVRVLISAVCLGWGGGRGRQRSK